MHLALQGARGAVAGRLVGWLVGWPVGWLYICLVGWPVGWLVGWFVVPLGSEQRSFPFLISFLDILRPMK